jgi:hypothetical protein
MARRGGFRLSPSLEKFRGASEVERDAAGAADRHAPAGAVAGEAARRGVPCATCADAHGQGYRAGEEPRGTATGLSPSMHFDLLCARRDPRRSA